MKYGEETNAQHDGVWNILGVRSMQTPLRSAKKLERIDDIKQGLLQEVERKLKQLQHIEDIRNTAEYRAAKAICEIRQQLRHDGVANSEKDANKLIELHYLKELVQNTQDK